MKLTAPDTTAQLPEQISLAHQTEQIASTEVSNKTVDQVNNAQVRLDYHINGILRSRELSSPSANGIFGRVDQCDQIGLPGCRR